MKVVMVFECDDLGELMKVCRKIIKRIIRISRLRKICFNRYFSMFCVRRIKCIETGSKTYKVYFRDKVISYDYRTVIRIMRYDFDGFVKINRSCYINIDFLDYVNKKGVFLIGEKEPLNITKTGLARLEKYID